jgi:predicted RNA-binding protein YlqC (UPF0109 family)
MLAQSQSQDTARCLSLIERLAAAVCHHPEQLQVNADVGASRVSIRFYAHPTDVGRLVGADGATLRALKTVASLLFFAQRKAVEFERVVDNGQLKEARRKFKPRADWPKDKLLSLLLDVARESFDDQDVTVKCVPGELAHNSRFVIRFGRKWVGLDRFGEALAVLGNPIGTANGQILKFDVEW